MDKPIRPEREEPKEKLSLMAYAVTQENATEQPFSGKYDDFYGKGVYVDIISGEPLFGSVEEYDAGCGWPSFSGPVTKRQVREKADFSHDIHQMEVRSKETDSRLEYVFAGGPVDQGGLCYCINSASLKFIPYEKMDELGYEEFRPLVE